MSERAGILTDGLALFHMRPAEKELFLELAAKGVFTHTELAIIWGKTPAQVLKTCGEAGITLPPHRPMEKFHASALDALALISVSFNKTGAVPHGIVRIAARTTSPTAIARLTGVPLDGITEALRVQQGEPDSSPA